MLVINWLSIKYKILKEYIFLISSFYPFNFLIRFFYPHFYYEIVSTTDHLILLNRYWFINIKTVKII